jgi:hypothetical protein
MWKTNAHFKKEMLYALRFTLYALCFTPCDLRLALYALRFTLKK